MNNKRIVKSLDKIYKYITDDFSYGNVKKNSTIYPRLSIEIFDIRNELSTESSKTRLNRGKRVQYHIDERYIKYRGKGNENFDLFEYIRLTTGMIETINNLVHGINDTDIKKKVYDIKGKSIMKLKEQIELNDKNKDVIYGYKTDKREGVKTGEANKEKGLFIIDVPKFGQLTWHLDDDTFQKMLETDCPEYPYEYERGKTNLDKINSRISKVEETPHNAIVKNIEDSDQNKIRRALDIYYANRDISNEEQREVAYRCLSKEIDMSDRLISTITKILNLDIDRVQKEREEERRRKEEEDEFDRRL